VGWKIQSWEDPEKVLPSETYLTLSNGFPQQIGISNVGKIHVVLYDVNSLNWLYTVKEPGATTFQVPHGVVQTDIYTIAPPAMILLMADYPAIAYADRDGGGPNYNLCYQQKQSGGLGVWGTPPQILSNHSTQIDGVFMFVLSSDSLKPRFFYLTNNKVYQTRRENSTTISPDPPQEFLSTALKAAVFQLGIDDVGLVYTTTTQSLTYTQYPATTPVVIWSTADPQVEIASISALADQNGKIHVVFGTRNPSDNQNPLYFSLCYLTNAGGSWPEKGSINGSATSGPAVDFAPAVTMTRDRDGEEHLHIAYTVWEPPLPTYSTWYAYFDEGGWQVADQSLDDSRNAIFPSLVCDDAGCLHVLYSDYKSGNERELYYMKGIPEKPQN
jgi:hypothetical protein